MTTLKYSLRLISDPLEFLNNYSQNLIQDQVIKTEHRKLWQQILNNL